MRELAKATQASEYVYTKIDVPEEKKEGQAPAKEPEVIDFAARDEATAKKLEGLNAQIQA